MMNEETADRRDALSYFGGRVAPASRRVASATSSFTPTSRAETIRQPTRVEMESRRDAWWRVNTARDVAQGTLCWTLEAQKAACRCEGAKGASMSVGVPRAVVRYEKRETVLRLRALICERAVGQGTQRELISLLSIAN